MKYNITVERTATSARSLVPPEFIEVRTVRPLRGCVGRKLFCMITSGFESKFTVLNSASYNKDIKSETNCMKYFKDVKIENK